MGFVAYATPELEARSQYPTIIAICVSLSACSILVVSMRLAIRTSKSALRLDDVMAFLAMILGTAYSVLCIVRTSLSSMVHPSSFSSTQDRTLLTEVTIEARYGLGLPPPLRPKQSMDTYAKVNYAGRPVYQVGISLFKIALLISYLHLLQVTSMKTYRIFVWVAIAFVSLSHLGSALSLIFACNPVQKSWKPLLPGTCLPDGASFTAYATLTIISDVLVTIIPLPVLMQVKVPRSKKFGLVGVFMLGLFTTVCSILRYTQINRVQFGDHDSTMLVLWGVIEFNTGVCTRRLQRVFFLSIQTNLLFYRILFLPCHF